MSDDEAMTSDQVHEEAQAGLQSGSTATDGKIEGKEERRVKFSETSTADDNPEFEENGYEAEANDGEDYALEVGNAPPKKRKNRKKRPASKRGAVCP
jgi:hypothetical protein